MWNSGSYNLLTERVHKANPAQPDGRYFDVRSPSISRVPALTGLRAIAAFWVLMLHYGEAVTLGWPPVLRRLFSSGFIGVDLFFVLSGFILSWNYLGEDRRLTVTPGQFWRARAARILPVYYVSLALSLPVFLLMQFGAGINPASIKSAIVTAVTTLTLTQSWVEPFSYLWNNPGWSLSVEVFLYLSFPFAARWIARKPLGSVIRATAILYGATIAAAIVFTALHPHPFVWKWEPEVEFCIWVSWLGCNPVVHFHELLLGAAACMVLREERSGARREFLPGPQAVLFSGAAIIGLLAWRGPMPFMAALAGVYSPLFALLIYGLAKQQGFLARILSTHTFVFLGEISFSFYMIHLIVWTNVDGHLREHPFIKPGSAANFFVCLGLSLILATLLYQFIEVPYRNALRKRWSEDAQTRPAAERFADALLPETR